MGSGEELAPRLARRRVGRAGWIGIDPARRLPPERLREQAAPQQRLEHDVELTRFRRQPRYAATPAAACCLSEVHRAEVAEGRMTPVRIEERPDVVVDGSPGLGLRWPGTAVDEFLLQGGEEALQAITRCPTQSPDAAHACSAMPRADSSATIELDSAYWQRTDPSCGRDPRSGCSNCRTPIQQRLERKLRPQCGRLIAQFDQHERAHEDKATIASQEEARSRIPKSADVRLMSVLTHVVSAI